MGANDHPESGPPRPSLPERLPENPGLSFDPLRSMNEVDTFAVDLPLPPKTKQDGSSIPRSDAYRFHGRIGQGGIGEVWESVQVCLGRVVAVKRPRQDLSVQEADPRVSRDFISRTFRQEAFITANLEHPNIVPFHDLQEDENGTPLLAMKLVRGRPWDELLREDFQSIEEGEFYGKHLPILISVTQAVAFAHARGVVHRDLKPSQVMVGEFGEVLLMDWGLALVHDRAPFDDFTEVLPMPLEFSTTMTASNPAGTVAYMAPEQTEKSARNIGPWTDVYLLGGILYELLTGRPPHHGTSGQMAFFQAAEGVVDAPESAAPPGRELPVDLVRTAMKALSRQRSERQQDAKAFLGELQDYLSGANRRRQSIALLEEARTLVPHVADAKEDSLIRALQPLEGALERWPQNSVARDMLGAVRDRLTKHRTRRIRLRIALATAMVVVILAISVGFTVQQNRLRAEAEKSRDQAIIAANTMVQDLAHGLRPLVGSQSPVLAEIVDNAAGIYDDLMKQVPDREDIQFAKAQSLTTLAGILRQMNRMDESAHRAEEAMAISGSWLPRTENEIHWLTVIHDSQLVLASVNSTKSDYLGAQRETEKARATVERALQLEPGNADWKVRHNVIRMLLASHMMMNRVPGGMDLLREAYAEAKALVREYPEMVNAWESLAAAGRNLGQSLLFVGGMEEAREAFDTQISAIMRTHSLITPTANIQHELVQALYYSSELSLRIGEYERALETAEEAERVGRTLHHSDRTHSLYKMAFTDALVIMGKTLLALARFEDALRYIEEIEAVSLQWMESNPDDYRHRNEYWNVLALRAEVYGYSGRYADALAVHERLAELIDEEVARQPQTFMLARKADQLLFHARLLLKVEPELGRERANGKLKEAHAILSELEASTGLTKEQRLSMETLDTMLSGQPDPRGEIFVRRERPKAGS